MSDDDIDGADQILIEAASAGEDRLSFDLHGSAGSGKPFGLVLRNGALINVQSVMYQGNG